MEDIYELIQGLTSSEWASFQRYLTCFSAHNPVKIKFLHLAEFLIGAKQCPTEAACILKLYGTKEESGFRVLKLRLKDKILDFLLSDIALANQEGLDKVDLAHIHIKKLSAQFQQLYYSKSRQPIALKLLEEIIAKAKEYEYYFSAVEHLKFYRGLIGLRKGEKEFERITNEINENLVASNYLLKAETYYQQLMIMYDFKGKPEKKLIKEFLKNAILSIKQGCDTIKSNSVTYYLKFLEMDFYQLQEDHRMARRTCLELLELVRYSKSVYRKQRVAVVYDHLSRCEYYLGSYKNAVSCAQDAQLHFIPNSENYCIALEQEYYALFAMKEYANAGVVAYKMVVSATRKELGEFRYGKYNYLLANVLFCERKYREAAGLLSVQLEISKDKVGWSLGLRILSVMILIETQKFDEAGFAVMALKQFVKNSEKKTPVSLRDKKILNFLLVAEKSSFNFSKLNGNADKYLKILSSPDVEHRWEPFTHEVIPFHEWVIAKMNRKAAMQKELEPKIGGRLLTKTDKLVAF